MTQKYQILRKKYFTASDYNKFTLDIIDTKIKEKGLVDKSADSGFINNADLNKKVAILAAKAEPKAEQYTEAVLQRCSLEEVF